MPMPFLCFVVVPALMIVSLVAGLRLGQFGARRRVKPADDLRLARESGPPCADAACTDTDAIEAATALETLETPGTSDPPAAAAPQPDSSRGSSVLDLPPAKLAAEGKIMIVDDELLNIRLAQKYLTLAGYQQIVGVTDSRTVMDKLAEVQPDVVLLDIMMPEVSGLEILAQIRAGQDWTYLPVIVVTAADNEATKVQALDLGATDFLGKPLNGTDLVPRVRNALLVKAHHDYLRHYAQELERQTRQLEAQIAQARTDALTGLANRRALDEELQRRFAECQRTGAPLSVMLLDVDHFKDFNDTHGHRTGDEALRVIAGVLRGAMRQMDLVTRYGGEEFFVILPGTAIDGARLVAERTRRDIGKTKFRYDGKDLSVTVSIGVAQLASNEHATRMLERVDHAMYASKKAGRNRSYWHDGREIHPVAEDSAAAHPAPAAALPRANPSSGAGSPCAVAPRSAQESPEALDYQYDRTAFLRHVRQRIAEWKRGGSAFCVLRIQVEQDEPVLDTPAREAGDQSLRLTVRILNAVVREMDLIGRYERGCFAVLLPCTTIEEGSIVAERVRQTIDRSDPFFDDHPMRFTLRVGLVEVAEGDDAVRLLQRAEVAMADQAGARTYGGDDRRNAPAQLPPQPQAADLPGVTFADGAGSSAGGEVHAG